MDSKTIQAEKELRDEVIKQAGKWYMAGVVLDMLKHPEAILSEAYDEYDFHQGDSEWKWEEKRTRYENQMEDAIKDLLQFRKYARGGIDG